MHENISRGRAYRRVLAVVLVALLSGCAVTTRTSPQTRVLPAVALRRLPLPHRHRRRRRHLRRLPRRAPRRSNGRRRRLRRTAATLANLAGYRIHYGKSAATLDQTIEIRNPSISSYVVEGLAPGTYYFAVTAFNSRNHESERSNAGLKEVT